MTADYLRDTVYPAFFHREQAPAWIAAVAAALGRAAPKAASWCEIGCGQGYGMAVLAAANPAVRFTGIDIDPGHIALAQARARAAGLTNVTFLCADIRDPALTDARFDHIVTHGVLSWVGDGVRRAIAGFIARHLTDDGIAAVHYMSEPGGTAFRAFHAVFRSVAQQPDPVAEGLRALTAMRDAGTGFFQLHPHAGQTLDKLLNDPPEYVAHEYLNPVFRPLAFHEIQTLFAPLGLSWLGSATPIENIDAVSIPAQAARAIGPVADRTLRETLKDMARNQSLRYDLFARPVAGLSDTAHLDLLRGVIWRLLPGAPAPGPLTFQTRIGPVEGEAAIFAPLLQALAAGDQPFAALERVPPFAGRPALLNQALQMLLWSGAAHPVRPVPDPAPARRLNRVLLDERRLGAAVPALACPALGSGLALGTADLDALSDGSAPRALRHLTALG
ncbi:class I SAM-dependent methyltransferase [uncultured Paracoccus sp.]|uniref:class I SAM-dependent methyltransferase n=1 Tax=uncultured Paracoccus sp. TaxID=189685 RepID=UPI0025DF255F|nr:class I SAM-dependent methyltransferase [uncultured Paracoccus sp.]